MSSLDDYLLSVARGRRGLVPAALRLGMGALAPVYSAGLKTYLLPYHLGIRQRERLPCPVVSIGNLTTGGTGKTPMTQTLCCLLSGQGKKAAILSRGYGGRHERGCAVVSDGQKVRLNAREAGDEAYLLARTLPDVPVLVGKDRRVTGKLAYAEFQPDVIVLDDGMQFWQLHRDLDIVLLNACEPFDNGWTFPRGLLREPPSHLRRAGIVVLTNVKRAGPERTREVQAVVQRLAPGRPVFTADLAPTGLRTLVGNVEHPADWLNGRRVAALAAIGNPSAFESMLGELGGILAARFRFRDHQEITLADMERVFAEACAAGAEAVITTDKDAVKMAPLKTPLPILALQVKMQVAGEANFLAAVQAALPKTAN
ncbi:MAG TPA: tetraacyldisaccharide 4'-kinase [Chthonomonadaceae bacterium]|nr:tetraacyldisaccharide 4'-kinase [Chthonomonadaceae bacterium]